MRILTGRGSDATLLLPVLPQAVLTRKTLRPQLFLMSSFQAGQKELSAAFRSPDCTIARRMLICRFALRWWPPARACWVQLRGYCMLISLTIEDCQSRGVTGPSALMLKAPKKAPNVLPY